MPPTLLPHAPIVIPKEEAQSELQPECSSTFQRNKRWKKEQPKGKKSFSNVRVLHSETNITQTFLCFSANIVQRETNGNRETRERLWWMIK